MVAFSPRYSDAEKTAINAITHKNATDALTLHGWRRVDPDKYPTHAANATGIELWRHDELKAAAWVILDNTGLPNTWNRKCELVSVFGLAHGFSHFEVIALLSGCVPWASGEVKTSLSRCDG